MNREGSGCAMNREGSGCASHFFIYHLHFSFLISHFSFKKEPSPSHCFVTVCFSVICAVKEKFRNLHHPSPPHARGCASRAHASASRVRRVSALVRCVRVHVRRASALVQCVRVHVARQRACAVRACACARRQRARVCCRRAKTVSVLPKNGERF